MIKTEVTAISWKIQKKLETCKMIEHLAGRGRNRVAQEIHDNIGHKLVSI